MSEPAAALASELLQLVVAVAQLDAVAVVFAGPFVVVVLWDDQECL